MVFGVFFCCLKIARKELELQIPKKGATDNSQQRTQKRRIKMEKPTLEYDGNLGKEQVRLLVKAYFHEKRLYIGLIKGEDGEPGLFDDLTVNLPNENLKEGEAFISDFDCKHKLQFIRKNRLGKVLQEIGHSGFCDYRKVQFDLKRLEELDPEGTREYILENEKLKGIANERVMQN
jgi:hypothetical protein